MDPVTFGTLERKLKQTPFPSDKISVLKDYCQYFFSANQCATVIGKFAHSSDKVEALSIMAPRLVTLTGVDGKTIVKEFTFAGDQVKAVKLIASRVYDPANKHIIIDAVTFGSDKDKARKILDSTSAAPPPAQAGYCGSYPTPTPYQPPPQQQQMPYQPPNQGGYPTAPPPGTYYPPPTQGTYPPTHSQGVYPPGPPPQGAYPPPPATSGYSQPPPPAGGVSFQYGVGGTPVSHQPPPPPSGEVNVQFGTGLGAFGFPTGNISFQVPRQWQ